MKVTVVGATGLIGARVVEVLRRSGHEVVAPSRSTGLDVLTGNGLTEALAGADALVDVTNARAWEPDTLMHFFTTSATNLVEAARAASVGHYVVLSIVGVDGLPDSPYMRAKVAQEAIVTGSGLPYSIVRSTQFAEFADGIIESLTADGSVRVPDALIQPIGADAVAAALADAVTGPPLNGIRNVGGPRAITFERLARDVLAWRGDSVTAIVVDPHARYYGAKLDERSLVAPAGSTT